MTTMTTTLDEDAEDLALLREFVRPEEDLRELRRWRPWTVGFRYFRSENVVCLEHYRRPRAKLEPERKAE
jgi:hypothetical protein